MRNKVVFNFLAVMISIVLGFVGLEFAFRAYLYLKYDEEPVVPGKVGRFDPRFGWSPKPNSSAVSHRIGEITYKINSKGLRDSEHEYQKEFGKKRIVIVGDSRTFGFGVPMEAHFTRLLEGYCENSEVINLGVAGFGVDQQLLYLKMEGFKYKPDLVIAYVAHYGDHRHMHTVRFGKNKPKFEVQDDSLILVNYPVEERKSDDKPFVNSAVIGQVVEIFRAEKDADEKKRDQDQEIADNKDAKFLDLLHATGNLIIKEMKNESMRNGAQFLLVSQVQELLDFAREENIHTLDVRHALDNQLYQLPDGLFHINASGNGALAWEIARFIRENKLPGC